MNEHDFTEVWQANRAYLVDLAYRMLGDVGEAEDVVQVAFSRLMQAEPGTIEDSRGWLIVVTSRLCLDHARSSRSRREQTQDMATMESSAGSAGAPADPADRITLDDDVRLALLVVLERLTSPERVAYVLHDIFQMPFATVAETVGRPAATCRQLARRARLKMEAGAPERRGRVSPDEHRQVVDSFIAACATGDLPALLAVLDPEVSGDADLGPGIPHPARFGADSVSTNLLRFIGPGTTLVSTPAGDRLSLLAFAERRLVALVTLDVDAGLIKKLHVTVDPAKIGFFSAQLAVSV